MSIVCVLDPRRASPQEHQSKESGDRGNEMDEKDGQVAHLAITRRRATCCEIKRGISGSFAQAHFS
jgi:hypothetical protein